MVSQFCTQAQVESWELLLEPLINLNQDWVQDTTETLGLLTNYRGLWAIPEQHRACDSGPEVPGFPTSVLLEAVVLRSAF